MQLVCRRGQLWSMTKPELLHTSVRDSLERFQTEWMPVLLPDLRGVKGLIKMEGAMCSSGDAARFELSVRIGGTDGDY